MRYKIYFFQEWSYFILMLLDTPQNFSHNLLDECLKEVDASLASMRHRYQLHILYDPDTAILDTATAV